MGIHEASLLHTAQLHIARSLSSDTTMADDKIVEIVMRHVKAIKDRDAPEEQWDMRREAEIVAGMLKTWQPKWTEYVTDRKREKAMERKKNNGCASALRRSGGRVSRKVDGRSGGASKRGRNALHLQ
jgi:hypothetical protein